MKLKIILFLLLALLSIEVKAQDPVFSQFFFVPETLNPAFTGTLNTLYAGVIHRTQWPDGNKKIQTNYGFINGPLDVDGKTGLGMTFLNHHETFTDYNYFQFNLAYAYNIDLNSDLRLRLGVESGYGRKNANFGNLLLEDQINTGNGGINGGSTDPGYLDYSQNIDFFDISAGLLLYSDKGWVGTSLRHLNRADISFTESGNVPLSMFLSVHGGYAFDIDNSRFNFTNKSKLLLTANYMRQAQYNRLDIGTALEFEKFTFGAIAATNPEGKSDNSHILTSINLIAGLQLDRFVLGYSYDINTSKFGNNQGIHEITLTFRVGRICPTCNNYLVKKPWGRNY